MKKIAFTILLLLVSTFAFAEPRRNSIIVRHYLKSLGLTKTPGCVITIVNGKRHSICQCQIDHRKPLKFEGKDEVENLDLLCGPVLKKKEVVEHNQRLFERWEKECLP